VLRVGDVTTSNCNEQRIRDLVINEYASRKRSTTAPKTQRWITWYAAVRCKYARALMWSERSEPGAVTCSDFCEYYGDGTSHPQCFNQFLNSRGLAHDVALLARVLSRWK
jgi:hypothetical protein